MLEYIHAHHEVEGAVRKRQPLARRTIYEGHILRHMFKVAGVEKVDIKACDLCQTPNNERSPASS